jgi:hypothetical protein
LEEKIRDLQMLDATVPFLLHVLSSVSGENKH